MNTALSAAFTDRQASITETRSAYTVFARLKITTSFEWGCSFFNRCISVERASASGLPSRCLMIAIRSGPFETATPSSSIATVKESGAAAGASGR
ncbi:MAG: hypothetical protein MPW15_09090 [Candidatus Manganitrophus sp.]|nr:hypothetical protein [Candidatus Manganitrophus sp.]